MKQIKFLHDPIYFCTLLFRAQVRTRNFNVVWPLSRLLSFFAFGFVCFFGAAVEADAAFFFGSSAAGLGSFLCSSLYFAAATL